MPRVFGSLGDELQEEGNLPVQRERAGQKPRGGENRQDGSVIVLVCGLSLQIRLCYLLLCWNNLAGEQCVAKSHTALTQCFTLGLCKSYLRLYKSLGKYTSGHYKSVSYPRTSSLPCFVPIGGVTGLEVQICLQHQICWQNLNRF